MEYNFSVLKVKTKMSVSKNLKTGMFILRCIKVLLPMMV